ncbi:hypothetical protein FHX08_005618 [Rhizobium sp. BK529]|uniref:hypothetical protein n=1 Tax=Rhizobium sp. BK529 TaxID=2586983 RepID=UPI001616A3AA|nr:hypothetical protein [Rhizobium sp. BK529]MBB3595208.1 hypothetical protein [Rhizobium sp. BK529]
MRIEDDTYSNQLEEVVTAMLAGLIAVAEARGQTADWYREQARNRLCEVDRIATNEAVRRMLFFATELACHLARMSAAGST